MNLFGVEGWITNHDLMYIYAYLKHQLPILKKRHDAYLCLSNIWIVNSKKYTSGLKTK